MRARRREINIFNMSLLDILCGALGAFCFMMLVALPYYIPPGSGLELRKAQKETDRLLLAISNLKVRLPDQKSIEEMEELMRQLEAQVKELQGRLNILTARNEELEGQVNRLTSERDTLQAQVQQLTSAKDQLQSQVIQLTNEKAQLAQQNQFLQARNQDLEKENANLKAQLAQKRPLSLMARADDATQSIDLVTLGQPRAEKRISPTPTSTASPAESMPFSSQVDKGMNPMFKTWLEGQFDVMNELRMALLNARGIAIGVLTDLPPGAGFKLYVRLASRPELRRATSVQCAMFGDIRYQPPMKIGRVTLSPERSWALVGTITIDQNFQPSFQEATAEEREAEWMTLTGATPPPTPTPTPPPSAAERAAAEALRAKQEAARLKVLEAHKKFTKLMQLPIADESGKYEAEILQLTEELLKDLPPRDHLRDEVRFRRERALEMKARREHPSPPASPSPNASVSPAPARSPTPMPSPTL